MDIRPFLNSVNAVILNPLIVLVFAIAFLIFFWGLFQFVASAGDGAKRDEGKKKIVWGLLGMLIMFSAYGLVRLTLGTFGVSQPSYLQGQ